MGWLKFAGGAAILIFMVVYASNLDKEKKAAESQLQYAYANAAAAISQLSDARSRIDELEYKNDDLEERLDRLCSEEGLGC